jgi:pimeloyl-ACP methyl ester carboxylesterase
MFTTNTLFRVLVISIVLLSLTTIISHGGPSSADGQTLCDNGEIRGSNQRVPVILVHGYAEDSGIWSEWEDLLEADGIPFCTVSFHDSGDMCGSAADHARELEQVVQQVKSITGQPTVNIVGHSKGGLDARVYLANTGTADVANLIMIGTPNAGSILADFAIFDFFPDICIPALFDLRTGASAMNAAQNANTNYFTIASECFFIYTSGIIPGSDDGVVAVSTVESLPYATPLGRTDNCHLNQLEQQEYRLAQPIFIAE